MEIFGLNISRVARRKTEATQTLGLASAMQPAGRKQPQSTSQTERVNIPKLGARISRKPGFNALSGAPDRAPGSADYRGLGRGRQSVEDTNLWTEFGFWQSYSARKKTAQYGLSPEFDLADVQNVDFDELTGILADLSPEISKALWDFINLSNSGYELRALRPNDDSEEIDEPGQAILDDMMNTIASYHGTAGVMFDRLFKMIFLRGSFLLELVMAENGRDFVDIATPDTKTLEFRRVNDPLRGQVWKFGQRQKGEFVDLDIPTIRYIPVHPNPDSIEGHPLVAPALFLGIFLMAVLRDTKRVVQHQGYMRLDVAVLFDKLKDTMPSEIQSDPNAIVKWMNDIVGAVEEVYSSLEPDDTYVHSDSIEVRDPVGTVSADSLDAIEALFKAIERMMVRALKTMPILLGTDQSRSETQANREWEIYAKGIETVQHWVESGFEYICNMRLRAAGSQARAQLRFAQFRAAEAMRDAQVDMLKAKVARYLYDCGYINQDEAAQRAAGLEKADVPEPRAADTPDGQGMNNDLQENPNPGEGRAAILQTLFSIVQGDRQPTVAEIEAAEKFLDSYAPDEAGELFDADIATTEEQDEANL